MVGHGRMSWLSQATAIVLLTVSWLWPFAGGPSAAVGPLLAAWVCAALLVLVVRRDALAPLSAGDVASSSHVGLALLSGLACLWRRGIGAAQRRVLWVAALGYAVVSTIAPSPRRCWNPRQLHRLNCGFQAQWSG